MKSIVAISSAVYQMGGYREEYLMKKRYLNALDYNAGRDRTLLMKFEQADLL